MSVITGFRFSTEGERNAFVAGLDFADSEDLVIMMPDEAQDNEGFWPVFILDQSEEPDVPGNDAEVNPTWDPGKATDLSFFSEPQEEWDNDDEDEDDEIGAADGLGPSRNGA